MLGTNINEATASIGPHHSFERSIIFIPKWLEKRVQAFSKTDKTLKNIDGLFSILIPADVSFYLQQVAAISRHPSVEPYFRSFNVHSHIDAASWDSNISAKKASKKYNELMDIIQRANQANDSRQFAPVDSYVENNTSSNSYAISDVQEMAGNRIDRNELAGILGVNADNPDIDLLNLRVIIEDLDADTLIMRVELFDHDQSRITQALSQTETNIRKITQYYEFNKVLATPIGKYYSRLVLMSPSS